MLSVKKLEQQLLYSIFEIDNYKIDALLVHIDIYNDWKTMNMEKLYIRQVNKYKIFSLDK